ncbi:unnamed protein product [Candida verbasci]|uniref:Uncharacterized protein n=1 Tax=Candida verbasci TaxID=1227364 RepID=A0A9W4XEA8_9ASCO|nr:unnamed protein product [Candida verbasci]
MIYDTIISPGLGIGNDIKLGSSLYNVVNNLDKFKYKIKILYSNKEYYDNPIIIQLLDLNIRLTFKNQCLDLIELLNLSNNQSRKLLRLNFNNQILNEIEGSNSEVTSCSSSTMSESSLTTSGSTFNTLISNSPAFQTIYNKVFGPTYPGILKNQFYILSYNGISFKFEILNTGLLECLKSIDDGQILSKLLNWDNPEDIICDSIAIFKGDSWKDYKQKPKPKDFNRLSIDLDKGIIKLSEEEIVIGSSTQQEILNLLGPPDELFNKTDSKFLIHNQLDTKSSFHNYFRLGIDILYDVKQSSYYDQNNLHSVVKKVILHNGGVAECLNFMKWNKCNWTIQVDKSTKITSEMYFNDLPTSFKTLTPVLLNRYESEFIDHDLDIIESPNINKRISDCKVKTWGQSKLYGFNRCILEVLNSNGCISSVTIY